MPSISKKEFLELLGHDVKLAYKKPLVLYKHSAPGFEKTFDTEVDLTEELSKWVCQGCKDECGTGLDDMLSSDCGCEFSMVEGADWLVD